MAGVVVAADVVVVVVVVVAAYNDGNDNDIYVNVIAT